MAESTPRYVAIITDGNGRWARQRGLGVGEGHRAGAETVRARLRDAVELGVRELTIYAFSTENWGRSPIEATTVADLVELSGVSRSAFYRHFDDKQACFLAAIEALIEPTLERIASDESAPAGIERARRTFELLIETIVSQPAAAKMCVVEIYAAGPQGRP
ncbi:MAG: undecaprenyl diphosphate synthase family protein [Thermoleophilia bacterium]|nr:undecaprenyl diphosphate synthase family protein [Thermoleophilia bacterium]